MKMVRFLAAAAVLLPACNNLPQGMGNLSGVVVVAPDSVWAVIGDSVYSALEPRIFTVRDERTFEVTHVSPADAAWADLRRFRQIIAVGAAGDAWVEPALRRSSNDVDAGIAVAENVWARNQRVWTVVVPAGSAPDAALPHVDPVAQSLDSIFRAGALQRMYQSRPDTTLQDSLLRTRGFGILMPNVYHPLTRDDDVSLFQSSTQMGGTLVRSILVVHETGLVPLTMENALAWRERAAGELYRPAHETLRDRVESRTLTVNGLPAMEVQGIWDGTDPSWPMSGPFMARVYHCEEQDRSYLVDAWVYAPGRPKYEYMVQLATILNTFRCGAGQD
ncbi:MAG TPA: DUF4837 family protein [Longimicrobiales bacterium]|nr:DUF4837 family protein [Longimicrobiales bacterium]